MTHDRGLTTAQRVRGLEIRIAKLEIRLSQVRDMVLARLKEEADAQKLD